MSFMDTEIIPRETLSVMVDSYQESCKEVDQAYGLLNQASQRMKTAFGDSHGDFSCLPSRDYQGAEGVRTRLRANAWKVILNRLEIKKIMSIKDLENLQKSFDDEKKIPEIELITVMDIVTGMLSNAPEYARRLVMEVYDILMPGTRATNYKTNLKNARRALGKKVILSYRVEPNYCGGFHVIFRQENSLTAIDKVFFTLDGKGIPSGYRSPLVDAINTTKSDGYGETDYFKFRCCLNRNLHLEFKRMDLVSKLNQIAGGGTRIAD